MFWDYLFFWKSKNEQEYQSTGVTFNTNGPFVASHSSCTDKAAMLKSKSCTGTRQTKGVHNYNGNFLFLSFSSATLGCVRVGSGVQTDATTPNNVAPTMLVVVACLLAVVCKRTQQLPTLLRQQCW